MDIFSLETPSHCPPPKPTLCSSTLDSEPSLRWPVSHGGCGLSERRFRPLRFRACLFSRQPTASAWSPPSPKPPRAACSELSSSADTRSWTSSSIVRRKCLRWGTKGYTSWLETCMDTYRHSGHQLALTGAMSSVCRTAMGATGRLGDIAGREKKKSGCVRFVGVDGQITVGGLTLQT